ncbi:hypothetical protein B0H14DRAFT_2584973 [Mycena olivaceomarginata]|nr:hypothetical protein B0H14DRAFT_2584973 [Mycena olivaceomarginata]
MTSRSGFDLEFSLTHAPPVRCDRGYQRHLSRRHTSIRDQAEAEQDEAQHLRFLLQPLSLQELDPKSVQPPAHGRLGGRVVKGDAQIHALTAAAQCHEKVEVRAIGNGACSASSGPRVAHTSGGYTANHDNCSVALNQNRNRSLLHGGLTGAVTGRLAYLPPRGKKLQPFEVSIIFSLRTPYIR